MGPLTGAVLASLIYNFILFPDTKTLAQRLAILTGTAEVAKAVEVEPEPQNEEPQFSGHPHAECVSENIELGPGPQAPERSSACEQQDGMTEFQVF